MTRTIRRIYPLAIAISLASVAILQGCGSDNNKTSMVQGQLIDSAIQGVSFSAAPSKLAGTTTSTGRFNCRADDVVTFKVGDITLGSSKCKTTITPIDLAKSTVWSNTDVNITNRLLFVQSLDKDDDASNGIEITSATATALKDKTLDFSLAASAFNSALSAVLPTDVKDVYGQSFSARIPNDERRAMAIEHFEGTLASMNMASGTTAHMQASAGGEIKITKYTLQAPSSLYIPYEGSNAAAKADFPQGFFPAVGSGLAFAGKNAAGDLQFYSITDRGPNGDSPNVPNPDANTSASILSLVSKMFPAPTFTPSIGLITVSADGAQIKSLLPIKTAEGQKISGRPAPLWTVGNTGEVPISDTLVFDDSVSFDANGLDTESLVYDKANNVFWTSDEYGPFIVKIDATTGKILQKFAPNSGLPAILAQRRTNRGMEGLAMDDAGHLNGFLQSPIDPVDKATNKSIETLDASDLDQDGNTIDKVNVKDFAQFTRWIVFNPENQTTVTYAYPLNYAIAGSKWDRNRTGSAKLGDVVSLGNNRFLVIEQGLGSDKIIHNYLMLVEVPSNVTDINTQGIELEKNSIDGTSGVLKYSEVVTLKKRLLLDLNAVGWTAEKAEGLTVVDTNTIALTNDNDFGLQSGLIDMMGQFIIPEGDITKCTVDVAGKIINDAKNCPKGVSGRVTRGRTTERPSRLWLIKLPKALSTYEVNVPTPLTPPAS